MGNGNLNFPVKQRKNTPPPHSLHWAFFHERGKDSKWTWPCYCGKLSGLMTKGHLSPSWRGFVVQHEFYQGWIDTGGWGAKREGLCPTLSPLPLIRVVWVTGDTRRGGDRPCIAPLPSISTSPRFHSPFSNTFFHQIHFVGNKNAGGEGMWRGQWGRRAGGQQQWQEEEERRGTEREHIQRKKLCKKQ